MAKDFQPNESTVLRTADLDIDTKRITNQPDRLQNPEKSIATKRRLGSRSQISWLVKYLRGVEQTPLSYDNSATLASSALSSSNLAQA